MVRFALATMTTPDGHDSNDRQPRRASAGWLVVFIATVLLAVYVLSTGPILWLGKHGYVSAGIGVIYAPLVLLAELSPFIRDVLNWYVGLWQ
jgi:hypothetical protein